MKRHGILNSNISRVLSSMGHTDRIAIADCGLPVPCLLYTSENRESEGYCDYEYVNVE